MGARTEALYTLVLSSLAIFLSLPLWIPLAVIVYDFIRIITIITPGPNSRAERNARAGPGRVCCLWNGTGRLVGH